MKVLKTDQYNRMPIGSGSVYTKVNEAHAYVYISATGDGIEVATELFGQPNGKDPKGYPVWNLEKIRHN